jgi:hypothetical protein
MNISSLCFYIQNSEKKILGSIDQTNQRDVHSLAEENRKLRFQRNGTGDVMQIDKMIGASTCFMGVYC